MRCAFCGGELRKASVTFSYEGDDTYLLVERVPAEVCLKCGERLYTPEVTDTLLQIARQPAKPKKIIRVPVYDFNEKVARL
jgi:HTH-type transcriptional regulator / antitoxin MqsA